MTIVVALVGSGASFTPVTVTVTVSTTVCTPSLVVTRKVSSVSSATFGAVKVGSSAKGSLRSTAGPPTCSQVCASSRPSGSEAWAGRRTTVFSAALKSGPASTVGASLSALTRMTTRSVTTWSPSVTSTSKVRYELVIPSGAVNEALGASPPVISTGTPPTCRQV